MRSPFRFWMTASFAVVMASLGGGRAAMASEAGDVPEVRASRYSVGETMQRLEECAARHGFTVFARVEPQAARHGAAEGFSTIVFASSSGGTPVLMYAADAEPDLLLSVRVRATAAGLSEVWIANGAWDELPEEVTRDLTELPALVADALT